METKVNYAVVGGFVLVLSAALIAGVLWLATSGGSKTEYDLYLALAEESVAGLNLNAPVKYRGVDVGKVREIVLDPGKPEQARLIFAIERDTPIKEDTQATLKTQGLRASPMWNSMAAPWLRRACMRSRRKNTR